MKKRGKNVKCVETEEERVNRQDDAMLGDISNLRNTSQLYSAVTVSTRSHLSSFGWVPPARPPLLSWREKVSQFHNSEDWQTNTKYIPSGWIIWNDLTSHYARQWLASHIICYGLVGALSSHHYCWYCYKTRILIIQLKMKIFEIIFKMLSLFKELKLERHLIRWLLVQILFWCMSITKGFQYASIKVKLLILLFWFFKTTFQSVCPDTPIFDIFLVKEWNLWQSLLWYISWHFNNNFYLKMTFAVWAYLIQFYAHLKFKILRIELFPITACLNGSPITQLLQPILFLSFEKF